jgi:hypothetical protein
MRDLHRLLGTAPASSTRRKEDEVGIGMLPYYDDVTAEPQNSIIGGATLWVLQGKDPNEYKGVAKFFTYLSPARGAGQVAQETGYVPITNAAYERPVAGYYAKNPGRDIAGQADDPLNPPTANSKGLRFGNFVQIRDRGRRGARGVLAGKKTPRRRWTTRSSAATRCSATSKPRTSSGLSAQRNSFTLPGERLGEGVTEGEASLMREEGRACRRSASLSGRRAALSAAGAADWRSR